MSSLSPHVADRVRFSQHGLTSRCPLRPLAPTTVAGSSAVDAQMLGAAGALSRTLT
jgi:hypothetical protein